MSSDAPGSDDEREAAYRLAEALGMPPPYMPSTDKCRNLLLAAEDRHRALGRAIEQARGALGLTK